MKVVLIMNADVAISCTIEIESVPGTVVATPVGDLTLENMIEWGGKVWQASEPEQRNILWDLRQARFDTNTTDIRKLADFVNMNEPDYNYKTAFVTANNLQYGIIRMFLAFRVTSRVTIAVFRTMERAKRWLVDEL